MPRDDHRDVLTRGVGTPADKWSREFLAALGTLEEEIERPPSTPIGQENEPFE